MKQLSLSLCFLLLFLSSQGQGRKVTTTEELSSQIQSKYKQPLDKVRAAYLWVTTNMHYSSEGILAMNHGINPRNIIDESFAKRRGVCENFAAIFTDLCRKMGFPSVVVDGYTTHNSIEGKDGHSWSAVFLDGEWYLFDPTWDIGKVSDFAYFKKNGEEFIQTHVPFDPLWQMLDYPLKENGKRSSAFFNYRDSIKLYFSLDSLSRFETATNRIKKEKPKNELTDTHLKILQNNLEIKRQEEQMNWYNVAVNFLNQAANTLNEFIDLRNEGFKSVKPAGHLKEFLAGIDEKLDSAGLSLDKVDRSKATLVYGTGPAREQLQKLKNRYQEQRIFLENYLREETSKR